MTVFLTLVLTVILSFVLTVIESARTNAIRFQIECASDMALYSALAEYNRSLMERYDLFLIDMSYGQSMGSPANIEDHIREYMEYNLETEKGLQLSKAKDFLALSAENTVLEHYSLATDENCLVLKSQAVSAMKSHAVTAVCEEIAKHADLIQNKKMLNGIRKDRDSIQAQIQSYQHRKVQTGEDEWEEVEVDNPADVIPIEDGGMLYLVTKDAAGISENAISTSRRLSARPLRKGEGVAADRERAEGITDELLFGEYLVKYCGCYTKEREGARLSYQLEYILNGEGRDSDNLKEAVNRILLIREASNYLYLQQDGGKQSQAEAAAGIVSAVLFFPELKELIKQALLLGWAYTESVNDVKLLLEGEKIMLMKTGEDWQMGFADMFHYRDCLGGSRGREQGMSYEDYMRVLLLLENPKEKAERFGDIVEMDVRATPGNRNFCLDNCVDSMEVFLEVSSRYGYRYDIRRRYGYGKLE